MATRAERFRAETARQGPKTTKNAKSRNSRRNAKSAANGASRTPSLAKKMGAAQPPDERRYGGPSTGIRNLKKGGDRSYDLEDTRAPQPPSRKSTRRSEEHVKLGTALTSRQQLKMNTPHAKHDRRGL